MRVWEVEIRPVGGLAWKGATAWDQTLCNDIMTYEGFHRGGVPPNGWFMRENPIVRNGWFWGYPVMTQETSRNVLNQTNCHCLDVVWPCVWMFFGCWDVKGAHLPMSPDPSPPWCFPLKGLVSFGSSSRSCKSCSAANPAWGWLGRNGVHKWGYP